MCWNDTEDIANNIAAAKSAVEQANNTVANVSNTLAPIQKQLEEWQKQYGDSNATSDDINKALNDANTSGACEEALRSEREWSWLAFHIKSNVFLCSCSGGAERDSSSADEEVGSSAEHLISAVQHLRQHPEDPPAHWTGSQCCQQGTALQKSQSIPVFPQCCRQWLDSLFFRWPCRCSLMVTQEYKWGRPVMWPTWQPIHRYTCTSSYHAPHVHYAKLTPPNPSLSSTLETKM